MSTEKNPEGEGGAKAMRKNDPKSEGYEINREKGSRWNALTKDAGSPESGKEGMPRDLEPW